VFEDLVAAGWRVSKKSVAASMARQGLAGRGPKRKRRSLTRPDKAAAPIPDLVKRDFAAGVINQRWCGDLTEIPTDEGKLYLATVLDLVDRRVVVDHSAIIEASSRFCGIPLSGPAAMGVLVG
jgi:transposase InsO family protein